MRPQPLPLSFASAVWHALLRALFHDALTCNRKSNRVTNPKKKKPNKPLSLHKLIISDICEGDRKQPWPLSQNEGPDNRRYFANYLNESTTKNRQQKGGTVAFVCLSFLAVSYSKPMISLPDSMTKAANPHSACQRAWPRLSQCLQAWAFHLCCFSTS